MGKRKIKKVEHTHDILCNECNVLYNNEYKVTFI